MESFDLRALTLRPKLPEIVCSTEEGRAVVLDLAPGESLAEHEVHERCWIVVLDGEVSVAGGAGERTDGGPGLLVQLAPGERHEVSATTQARLLMLLTPWPGNGHPGALSLREKLYVRRHAAHSAAAAKR